MKEWMLSMVIMIEIMNQHHGKISSFDKICKNEIQSLLEVGT